MKITCTRDHLVKGVNTVSKIATTRGTLPILSNILLKAKDGEITLAATDLEIGISTSLVGKIELEGSITIPARLINEFVNTCNDDKITLELDGEILVVTSERYNARFNGLDASEFPIIPVVKGAPFARFGADAFRTAISQVVFAASVDETRPVLTGVNFRFFDSQVKLAATDSYRLAEKVVPLEKEVAEETLTIIPARALLEMLRVITPEDETVEFYLGDNQVMVTVGKTQLVSRIIEGKFPDYEKLIPQDFTNTTKLPKSELVNALKVIGLFARESANNVRLKMKPEGLEVVAVAPQVGDNTASLSAKTTGDAMEIAFNIKYLADALTHIPQSEVILGTNNPKTSERSDPGLLTGEGDTSCKFIIMPLRLDE